MSERVRNSQDAPTRRVGVALTAELPAGWYHKQQLTLGDADRRMSVIFSAEEVSEPGLTTEAYARAQDALLSREFRNFTPIALDRAQVFGGHDGMRHHFVWEPEDDGPPVEQIQIYLVHDGFVYLATATTWVEQFDELGPLLEELLLGLRVERGAPAPDRSEPAAPES